MSQADIVYQALVYRWHDGAGLSREQAMYALAEIWRRVGGNASWSDSPIIFIPAAGVMGFKNLYAIKELNWVTADDFFTQRGPVLDGNQHLLPVLGIAQWDEGSGFSICFDLVLAFFSILSCWDVHNDLLPTDEWGNPRESESFVIRHGLEAKPFLDQWAMAIRLKLQNHDSDWSPGCNRFRVLPTHDIDHLLRYPSITVLPKRVASEIVRRRSLLAGIACIWDGIRSRLCFRADPGWRLVGELARLNQGIGQAGVFFFMSARPGPYTSGYRLNSMAGQKALDEVLRLDQRVGWHPGYEAALGPGQFIQEHKNFRGAFGGDLADVRMHYLRWRPFHLHVYESIGVKNDYSWGFNTRIGFSHGTCHPFIIWCHQRQCRSSVVETPLLLQDGPLAMALNGNRSEASSMVASLLKEVRDVGGTFTFLLHNNIRYGDIEFNTVADLVYGNIASKVA